MSSEELELTNIAADAAGLGDPTYYLLTISTEGQMDEMLDSIAKSMREKIK